MKIVNKHLLLPVIENWVINYWIPGSKVNAAHVIKKLRAEKHVDSETYRETVEKTVLVCFKKLLSNIV
jgi:hypothetical protein